MHRCVWKHIYIHLYMHRNVYIYIYINYIGTYIYMHRNTCIHIYIYSPKHGKTIQKTRKTQTPKRSRRKHSKTIEKTNTKQTKTLDSTEIRGLVQGPEPWSLWNLCFFWFLFVFSMVLQCFGLDLFGCFLICFGFSMVLLCFWHCSGRQSGPGPRTLISVES